MRLVTVASFSFPAQAQPTRALLEGEGIPCFVAGEHLVNVEGAYPVEIRVPEDAVEAALAILADVDAPSEGEDAPLVAVAQFGNPLDAHAAAAALDRAGIAHRISGEGAFGAGVSVLVAEEDLDAARQALGAG